MDTDSSHHIDQDIAFQMGDPRDVYTANEVRASGSPVNHASTFWERVLCAGALRRQVHHGASKSQEDHLTNDPRISAFEVIHASTC